MKHIIAGAVVAGVFLGVVILWALLGALVGPVWAITVLVLTLAIWGVVAWYDYISEHPRPPSGEGS